ncbi:MAG: 50S ribosomal protein L4 [Gammaproteobacteria bacterium]|nr:MAG: 50S ribosomal protein L4 [Gammaproteobacteria bacterium]
MELQVTGAGKKAAKVEVSDALFGAPYNESLVHQVVTAYRAAGRAGTHKQKTRSEVSGGGKKPWNQKGSGQARAGTSRSPLWRKGGKIFAAAPQDYSKKVNKKMYRGAMRAILSELVRAGRLVLVNDLAQDKIKTRELAAKLAALELNSALIVTEQMDDKLALSARNLPKFAVTPAAAVDPVNLVGFDKVVMTVGALRHLEKVLA